MSFIDFFGHILFRSWWSGGAGAAAAQPRVPVHQDSVQIFHQHAAHMEKQLQDFIALQAQAPICDVPLRTSVPADGVHAQVVPLLEFHSLTDVQEVSRAMVRWLGFQSNSFAMHSHYITTDFMKRRYAPEIQKDMYLVAFHTQFQNLWRNAWTEHLDKGLSPDAAGAPLLSDVLGISQDHSDRVRDICTNWTKIAGTPIDRSRWLLFIQNTLTSLFRQVPLYTIAGVSPEQEWPQNIWFSLRCAIDETMCNELAANRHASMSAKTAASLLSYAEPPLRAMLAYYQTEGAPRLPPGEAPMAEQKGADAVQSVYVCGFLFQLPLFTTWNQSRHCTAFEWGFAPDLRLFMSFDVPRAHEQCREAYARQLAEAKSSADQGVNGFRTHLMFCMRSDLPSALAASSDQLTMYLLPLYCRYIILWDMRRHSSSV